MNDTKAWYESKGVWGSIISLASLGMALFGGHAMTPEAQVTLVDQLTVAISAVGVLVGSILAFVGRITAKSQIAPKAAGGGLRTNPPDA